MASLMGTERCSRKFRGRRRGDTPPIGQAEKLRLAGIARTLTGSLLALLLGNAEAQQCVTERVGHAELTEERGHYQVPVVIDQAAPLNFVVDTGAQKTVINTEIAASLGLARRGDRRRRITGTDGVAGRAYHDVTARTLDFAGLQHFDIGLATADDKEDGKRAVRGTMGADLLGRYDVELDYPGNRLGLFKVTGCGDQDKALKPWAGPHDAVPLTLSDGTLSLAVFLDGKPLNMALDTGAMRTKITMAAARKLGLDVDRLKSEAPLTISRSSSGAEVKNYTQRFDTVRIGQSTYANIDIKISEIVVGPYDGLLGLDFLRSRKIWVSYATQQLFVHRGR
jgi:predicted aspartyl protease